MWDLEGQVGIECAARWEKHFRQHKQYEQSDVRKKGNCGVFRGIEVGYLNVVNIKWRDDKLERHLREDKPDHRRRQWHPAPVLLPGKSHGQRSLVGCSPWGREELDTTERLHFHFSLSCVGEGNGNPLQCSCLENPRDGGAWWAAVYGVAQSRTRLKRLSSSKPDHERFWMSG